MNAKPSPFKRTEGDLRILMLRRLDEAKPRLNERALVEYAPGVFKKNAHYNPNDQFRRERQPMKQIYYKSLYVRKDIRLIAYREAGSSECAYAILSDANVYVYGFTLLEIVMTVMPTSISYEQLNRTYETISAQLDALTR